MKIAITPANAAKIEALLKVVNRDFVVHTFSTFDQIAREADNAEATLLKLINKGDAKGAYYVTISGEAVPNARRFARTGRRAAPCALPPRHQPHAPRARVRGRR